MAERLTESEVSKSFTEQELRTSEQARIYQKLGELEDIMDDFHISCIDELHERLCWVEEQKRELDKIYAIFEKYHIKKISHLNARLAGEQKSHKSSVAWQTKYNETKQDRDTWKRACELACEWFKQTGFIGDQTKVDYFYQQAKKEGESK